MRVTELTPDHVRRAIAIYLELAWPPAESSLAPPVRTEDFADAATLDALFARFEQRPEDQRGDLHHFALRLGNLRYPFMKLVVQEFLVDDELFFAVDTHDDLTLDSGAPDFERWVELKRWNRELKNRIEAAWHAAGLPTSGGLLELAQRLAAEDTAPGPAGGRGRVLVVDDEPQVAQSVRALLAAQGYEVECVHSGERVLERLAEDPLPDLLMLDYEMPGLDGFEVLQRLRAEPRTAKLPVLLATASDIELSRLRRVSGFLRKPYPRQLLYRLVGELVQLSGRAGPARPAPHSSPEPKD